MKGDGVYYSYTADASGSEEENRILRESVQNLEREIEKYKRSPLLVCEVKDLVGKQALIRLPNSSEFLVEISADCDTLHPGDTVLAEQKSLTIIKKIPQSKKFDVSRFLIVEKPKITWKNIGGLDEQVQEVTEVIELPLKKPKLFKKIGIEPPKGILLHGPPGTGKTMLAKAVAHSTDSSFIQVVGSELVQKFIGEGAKLVKEMFELAREQAPTIIFIDEIDAIGAKRIDLGTSGEREVQRTFMQLLAEIDGFKPLDNVKIIGCTNRKDILDEALLRPGRLDRLIYVPLPDEAGRKEIFSIHSKKVCMERVRKDLIIKKMNGLSGADIKSVITEAGYLAIRDSRHKISEKDLLLAIEKVKSKHEENHEHLMMFG
ncbi:AAA family ATPase [Candidatus Woesearchaeota archaeon]|nr:AAA family ATPase [Candidatus Woesearchaeota archaeon]